MKVIALCLFVVAAGISADSTSDYMASVLTLAGTYLSSLSMEPARIPCNVSVTAWNLQSDINIIEIAGLGRLTPKKCKIQRPKVECDVSLKPVTFTALGRFKDGHIFQDLTVRLPVKEGELEIEINTETKASKVKFDDNLIFGKLEFSQRTSNTKALEETAKALNAKLTPVIVNFLGHDFFDVLNNAALHSEVPMHL